MDLLQRYEHVAEWIVGLCAEPDKFAHTHAGMAIWLLATLAFRARWGAIRPLLAVIAFELVYEIINRLAHGSWIWRDTFADAIATCFWPAILTAAFRLWPQTRPVDTEKFAGFTIGNAFAEIVFVPQDPEDGTPTHPMPEKPSQAVLWIIPATFVALLLVGAIGASLLF